MVFGSVVLLAYAALMLVGGAIGFAKAGSRPSLVAGSTSAVLLLVLWRLAATSPRVAYGSGAALALVLAATFGVRLARTKKAMPSGALLAASLLAAALLAIVAVRP